jgi:hypothetical protein
VTQKLLKAAKAGKVAQLLKLAEAAHDGNQVAYKWLLIAADFGHDTNAQLDALLELPPFQYDDEQSIEALIHYEIGLAYLQGKDGLALDLVGAKAHLEFARELKVHAELHPTFAALRRTLKADALGVFNAIFAPPKAAARAKPKPKAKAKAKAKNAPTRRPR